MGKDLETTPIGKNNCLVTSGIKELVLYDNEYASFIDIYFYEFFQPSQTSSACAPKYLSFSLIKIEPVSIKPKPKCA
jgi:hypothetical protein